ncbi:MAG: hypothetical protein VX278_03630, partial [Myxococcota bacterium]|nr:hypothetical protein [Myxococcota bacterium]
MISYVLGITFALAEPYVAVLQSDSYIEYKTPTSSFLKKLQYKVKAFDLHGDREIALRRINELKKRKPKVIFAVGAKAAWIT